MDKDDVEVEVLYPTVSFGMWKAPDIDYQFACMRAYNRWMSDYARSAPGRLVGLGLVSLTDVDKAAEELRSFPALGLRGACIAATPRAGETYALPKFDPFWAVAQDLGLPISLHVLTGSEQDRDTSGARDFVADYAMWPRFVQQTIADLITGGVLERFPRLKVISAEIDVGWIQTRTRERAPCRDGGHFRRADMRDPALLHPGPGHDPLIVRIQEGREIGIREDRRRHGRPPPDNGRVGHGRIFSLIFQPGIRLCAWLEARLTGIASPRTFVQQSSACRSDCPDVPCAARPRRSPFPARFRSRPR